MAQDSLKFPVGITSAIANQPEQDYSSAIDPSTIKSNPRYLKDLRDHYTKEGVNVAVFTDEELINRFHSDQIWNTLNTVSAVGEAADAFGMGATDKARTNRLMNVYRQLPNFWQEGGRGTWETLKDAVPALLADPVNYVTLGIGAAAKGANVARVGIAGGMEAAQAASAGTRAGVLNAARNEAIIGGVQEGIVDTANQVRDIQLGLRKDFSVGELAGRSALGAGLSGAIAAPLSYLPARSGAREGVQQAEAGRFLGMSGEEIAAMSPKEAEAAYQAAQQTMGPFQSAEARAAQEAATAAPETPTGKPAEPVDPVTAQFADADQRLEAQLAANRERVIRMQTSGVDPELVAEASMRRDAVARLRGVIDRLKVEQTEIIKLGQTNDVASLAKRDARLTAFEKDYADLNTLLRQTDTLDPEELMTRINAAEEAARAKRATEAGSDGKPAAGAEATPAATTEGAGATPPTAPAPSAARPATEGAEAATDATPAAAGTEVAPTTPAAPAAPTAETTPLTYSSDNVRASVASRLQSAGMTEDQLRELIASGSIPVGRKGQLTRESVGSLTAHIEVKRGSEAFARAFGKTDPAAAAPETATPTGATAQAKAAPIADELRGEALASGFDYRNMAGNPNSPEGRVTQRQLRKELKGRDANAAPDPYAANAQKELGQILDLMGSRNVDDATLEKAIRLLASDTTQFKTSADDLVALANYAKRGVSQSNPADEGFTKTELKKIERQARMIKKNNPGFTDDTASAIAQAQVVRSRGDIGESPRGTGEAIERAKNYTTAGLTNTGRIQEFLRMGTRISKGSDYTITGANQVRPNEFGFEAALIRARSGNGPDVVPYTLMGTETVLTRSGKQKMAKGTVAYADAVTGRSYESMDLAIEVREGGSASTRASATPSAAQAAPQDGLGEDLLAALNTGDAATFRRMLEALKRQDAPSTDPAAAARDMIPLTRGDKLLIVRSKSDPTDVRMISPKQAKAGKDISAIIGKNGDKADPNNWEFRYAPAERFTANEAQLAALFEGLPAEGADALARGGRYEAGFATGLGQPLSTERAGKTLLGDLTPEQSAAFKAAGMPADASFNVNHAYMAAVKLESMPWATKAANHRAIIEHLRNMYALMDRVAPQGMQLEEASRIKSVESLRGVFSKYSSSELEEAAKFIERLGGDPNIGPRFEGGSTPQLSTSMGGDGGAINQQINIPGKSLDSRSKPPITTLYHEVAHWSYFNILTPKDRMDFWDYAARFYDEKGNLDRAALRDRLPSYDGMETEAGRVFGGNSEFSPQELFARQFEMWVTRNHGPDFINQPTYWQKVSSYVKAVFDRYVRGAKIDAELEPLFAKILPPEDRNVFKLGVDSAATTEAGKHYQKRWVELKLLREDLDDAFSRDSADAIGTATGEIVKYLLSVAPRGSTISQPNTGTLAPLKRLYRMIHQRIDDVDEIVAGKPFDYNGLGADTSRGTPEWMEMGFTEHADPQAVADLLRDHYHNGYAGKFQPQNGLPGNIKKLEKSSLSSMLDMISTALEGAYRSAENGNMVAGAKPALDAAGGSKRPTSSKVIQVARKRAARSEAAVGADALNVTKTPVSQRQRMAPSAGKEIDPATAEEIKTKSLSELRKMYVENRGSARGDQIAFALVAKERAQPLPPKSVPITREIMGMTADQLQAGLLDALHENKTALIDQFTYEMRRRFVNKGRKAEGLPRIEPTFNQSIEAINREVNDSLGVPSNDGIPASARASVREVLSFVTHRDPDIQHTARTMTYRMLNLMNKTTRENLGQVNFMTASDIARLANVEPSEVGTSVFADLRSPEFNTLRKDMRRMAIGLTKESSSPFDVIHEVGHMVVRSGSLRGEEMDAIREAYRLANGETKQRIQDVYGPKYANRVTGNAEDRLAEEWFSETLAHYMAERVTRGDVLKASNANDITNLKLRNSFDRALDRTIEYTAYVVNGLIGRNDIKQQFRRLVLFGDMFEKPNMSPMGRLASDAPAIHPSHAADVVGDFLAASPRNYKEKARAFVGDGLSYDAARDKLIPFYHGTPNGYAFNRKDNPNVVMRPSVQGMFGPGTYIGNNPHVASQVYANRPTLESIRAQIMDMKIPDEQKSDLLFDAMDLTEARKRISQERRNYYLEQNGEASPNRLAEIKNNLDELVENEKAYLDALSAAGVKTDPLVIPVYLRVRNPVDFQESAMFDNAQDPLIRSVVRYMGMTQTATPSALQRLNSAFSSGPLNGAETYQELVRLYTNSGRSRIRAQAELNETLEDLGYDALLTTHRNTIDVDGTERMMNSNTYEGTVQTSQGVVVFNPTNIKHMMASEFNAADERLYYRDMDVIPKGTNAQIMHSVANDSIDGFHQINPGALGEILEARGADSSITGALMSMIRGRKLDVKEEQAIRRVGPRGFLDAQDQRMRKLGANYLADWYKNQFPDIQQKFAAKYFPIHHALRALPDADGKVRSWARKASGGVGQEQPKSYTRIVKALRYGNGSRQEKALNAQERVIWNQIRTSLANERQELVAKGLHVGDRGPNYFPQVWNTGKIQKDREMFLAEMAHYYKIEKTSKGVLATQEEADDFARGIFETLAGDGADGTYIPLRGSSRNPKFDNVDYSRVIELDKYPEAMKRLEPYLEDDLEALLVKYFEGSTRKVSHAEKMGINSHGFYDYIQIAENGKQAIARLLSHNKEFSRDVRAMDEGGYPAWGVLSETVRMPFQGREDMAQQFTTQLVETHRNRGGAAARQLLDDIAPRDPDGNIHQAYSRRADAIVGALNDYKGEKAMWESGEYDFMENALRVAMKKPQVGNGTRALSTTSQAIRSFNNVTLLGFTTLTSIPDIMLPIIRSGEFKAWTQAIGKFASDPEYKRMIHDVGVAMESIVHDRMIHMYGAPDNRISNAFFNATMLTPWSDTMRQIAGATGYESFKTMQRRAFNEFKEGVPLAQQSGSYKTAWRYMNRYGLQDYLPDGDKSHIDLGDRRLLTEDEGIRTAVISFANEAQFAPNANDIPLWAQTPIGAIVFQLKSYPLMMMRMGKYVVSEASKGNVKPLAYFATLGPAFGAGTLAIKDIVQSRGGDDNKEMALRKRNILKVLGYDKKIHGDEQDFLGWYAEGMVTMGGLGLLGDIMHSAVQQADNGAYGKVRMFSTLFGPTVGDMSAVMEVAGGIFDKKDSNAKERSAWREVATRVPVLGGVASFREGVTDALAGEASDGKGGWNASSDWGKSWDTKWK